MPKEPSFPFVNDEVLRENLEITFDHLVKLLSLSELPEYTETLKSSFRKTVIIFDQVDKVRVLRNRLHISTLKVIEKDYSKEDLEFVFSVAREVKNLAKNFPD